MTSSFYSDKNIISLLSFAVIAMFALGVSGCATVDKAPRTIKESFRWKGGGDEEGWWYARFRWSWPPEEKPRWFLDYVAAHRIAAPVLKQFESELDLWRFHRRAARDQSGHQFSLIFYSSRKTAYRVCERLDTDPLTTDLRREGLLDKMVFDLPGEDSVPRPGIGDTSDKRWPLEVQNSWPFYIMGVSRMWVELIDQITLEIDGNPDHFALEPLLEFYAGVEKRVVQIWQENGNHAYLHHLNAIFGYEPLMIYEKRMMQF